MSNIFFVFSLWEILSVHPFSLSVHPFWKNKVIQKLSITRLASDCIFLGKQRSKSHNPIVIVVDKFGKDETRCYLEVKCGSAENGTIFSSFKIVEGEQFEELDTFPCDDQHVHIAHKLASLVLIVVQQYQRPMALVLSISCLWHKWPAFCLLYRLFLFRI
jgi:hypothetical protein